MGLGGTGVDTHSTLFCVHLSCRRTHPALPVTPAGQQEGRERGQVSVSCGDVQHGQLCEGSVQHNGQPLDVLLLALKE
jgi:hypothetical protein